MSEIVLITPSRVIAVVLVLLGFIVALTTIRDSTIILSSITGVRYWFAIIQMLFNPVTIAGLIVWSWTK